MKKILSLLATISLINFPILNGVSENDIINKTKNISTSNLKDFNFENYETHILDEIKNDIKETSEMHYTEQAFLNG